MRRKPETGGRVCEIYTDWICHHDYSSAHHNTSFWSHTHHHTLHRPRSAHLTSLHLQVPMTFSSLLLEVTSVMEVLNMAHSDSMFCKEQRPPTGDHWTAFIQVSEKKHSKSDDSITIPIINFWFIFQLFKDPSSVERSDKESFEDFVIAQLHPD